MQARQHVVLMGMMGAGKTSVGRALAARLGVPYEDNDEHLRSRTGLDAAAMVAARGAGALHVIEHDILAEAVHLPDAAVISAPGSVALDASAEALLAGQHVVWLRATLQTLAARVGRDRVRPLLGDDMADSLAALAAEREPGFARLADVAVDVDDSGVDSVVDLLLKTLARPPGEQLGSGA